MKIEQHSSIATGDAKTTSDRLSGKVRRPGAPQVLNSRHLLHEEAPFDNETNQGDEGTIEHIKAEVNDDYHQSMSASVANSQMRGRENTIDKSKPNNMQQFHMEQTEQGIVDNLKIYEHLASETEDDQQTQMQDSSRKNNASKAYGNITYIISSPTS